MKKNKIISLLMILAGTLTIMTGCGESKTTNGSNAGKKVEIRLAHDNNGTSPGHLAFLEFEKIVKEKSNGRITVKIFPNGQLGSAQDTFEQVRRGDIDMSVNATSNLVQTIPEFAVWDQFYMFDNAEHAHRVLDGKAGTELIKPLEKMNLVGLGYMEIGFRNFSNSKRPIVKAEDVKKLKIRGYNPIQIKAWESVGATLTNLSWTEVFTSLQQNLIDGQECATSNFYSSKFYEAQKYWSLTQHVYTNWLWFANKDFMNKLSPEDRKIIEDAAKETIKINRELIAKDEKATLEKLPGLGIKVNEVALSERQKMGKIMNAAVKNDIIAKCGQSIYDLVNSEIEKERTK